MTWLEMLARLSVAALAGGAVGWERHMRRRPAGLRTHMLVSIGAAIVVLIPGETGVSDLGHAIQGVATGVGFICAGEILRRYRLGIGEEVTGLTSAAALWLTAGLGMAAGKARWPLVAIGTTFALVTLAAVRVLERFPSLRPRDEVTKHEARDVKSE